MRRVFGWLFALAAVITLGWEVLRGPLSDQPFELAAVGEVWARIDRTSLIGLNSFTEKRIGPDFWDTVIFPVMESPAVIVFAALALIFLALAGIGRRRGRGRMFGRR